MKDNIDNKFIKAYKDLLFEEASEIMENAKSDIFKKFNTIDADDKNFENQIAYTKKVQEKHPEAMPPNVYLKVKKLKNHIGIFHGNNYSGGGYDDNREDNVSINDEMFYVTWEKGWSPNQPSIVYVVWDLHKLMNPFTKYPTHMKIVNSVDELAELMDLSKDYSKEYISKNL